MFKNKINLSALKRRGIATSLLDRFVIYGKFSDISNVHILKSFVGGKEKIDSSIKVFDKGFCEIDVHAISNNRKGNSISHHIQ
jgi:hypothetical protein